MCLGRTSSVGRLPEVYYKHNLHKPYIIGSDEDPGLLRGNFFQCHVFAMKSVQNLKSFWRSIPLKITLF